MDNDRSENSQVNDQPRGDSKASPNVVILVPTYNEVANIEELVRRIRAAVPTAHMLVIDDNSPDGTADKVETLRAQFPGCISLMRRPGKNGLGRAYEEGYAYALKEWPSVRFLVQMDADLSHLPEYLPGILEAASNADVVVGSRYTCGVSAVNWPLRRIILSCTGTLFTRIVTGLPLTDCTSGFKCYRAEVAREIFKTPIMSSGYVFQVETVFRAWRSGYHLVDFPIVFHERTAGTSKINLHIAVEAIGVILRLGIQRIFQKQKS